MTHYTFKECAELCGVTVAKLRIIKASRFTNGKFPEGYGKTGYKHQLFYRKNEIEEWLKDNPDPNDKSTMWYRDGKDREFSRSSQRPILSVLNFPVMRRKEFTGKGKVLQHVRVAGDW